MILFDTTILVEILCKMNKMIEFLQKLGTTPLFVTEISVMELAYGITGNRFYADKPELKQRRLTEIQNLFSKFTLLPFDHKSAMKTAQIMGMLKLEGKLVDFRDGMIAGIGLANGIEELLTLDREHFERIKELKIITINSK